MGTLVGGRFQALAGGLCLAAALICSAPHASHAGIAAESHEILTMEYQQVGTTEEEAVRLACIRAVKASIGRLLFSDYSLQARDLLEPYIQLNWQKYVASTYVLERRADRDGFGTRIRVQTFPEVLFKDLREKKFLYLPQNEPRHIVFLAEVSNGEVATVGTGRDAVIATLEAAGARTLQESVPGVPSNLSVLSSPASLSAAREAATRQGAEIIVAGIASTNTVKSEEVFYDSFVTVETALKIAFIRTDDGVILGESEIVQRASEAEEAVARETSIRQAAERTVARIQPKVAADWQIKDRGKARFELLLTHLMPDEVGLVERHLETHLSRGTKAELVSHYGDVAVIALSTPRDYSALQRAVLDFKAFDLRITDRQGRRVTVDVKH